MAIWGTGLRVLAENFAILWGHCVPISDFLVIFHDVIDRVMAIFYRQQAYTVRCILSVLACILYSLARTTATWFSFCISQNFEIVPALSPLGRWYGAGPAGQMIDK